MRRGVAGMLVVAALLGLVMVSPPAARADVLEDTTSLGFVPADVQFYVAWLRNREQYDLFVNSRAFAKLRQLPVVQMGVALLDVQRQDRDSPLGQFETWRQQPENRELLSLLGEMVSQEVFLHGDAAWADFGTLLQQMKAARNIGRMRATFQGLTVRSERRVHELRSILETLNENLDLISIPRTVLGFKLSQRRRAEAQLTRLEKWIKEQPQLENRWARVMDAHSQSLVIRLDGSLVFEHVSFEDIEEEPGEFGLLAETLRSLALTVTFKLRGDYLLIELDDASVEIVSGDTGRLYDLPEFDPLREQAKQRLTNIRYGAPGVGQTTAAGTQLLDQLSTLIDTAVTYLDIDQSLQDEMWSDLDDLHLQLADRDTEPGATMGFTYLTDDGYESYTYHSSESIGLVGTQTLTLLQHVGGMPLAFAVARAEYHPEDYQLFAKTVERVYHYADTIAQSKLDDGQRMIYMMYRDVVVPAVKRVHEATSEKLTPALRDGQGGIVLDAKSTSKQWSQLLPMSRQDLPLPELALIFGVSDAKLLREAMGEYYGAIQDVIDGLHRLHPEQIPEFKLPRPTARQVADGTVYVFETSATLGLDARIAFNAGLSDNVAVLSFSPPQTERLLKRTPLQVKFSPLSEAVNRQLAAAGSADWPGIVDLLVPWGNYIFDLTRPAAAAEATGDEPQVEQIKAQILDAVRILQCFRGGSRIQYQQDNAWITHSRTYWKDLDAK